MELLYPNFPTMGNDGGNDAPENEHLYPDYPAMGIDNENAADRIQIRIGNGGEIHSGNDDGVN